MRKLYAFIISVVLSLGLSLAAQTVTVSGSNITDSTGTPLASGTISFQPTTCTAVYTGPLCNASYKMGGKGQTLSRAVTATVTNGAFTITLPDTNDTDPQNVGFNVTVTDNVTGDSVLGSGYQFVQPGSQSTNSGWCSGSPLVCNFDIYEPGLATIAMNPGFLNLTASGWDSNCGGANRNCNTGAMDDTTKGFFQWNHFESTTPSSDSLCWATGTHTYGDFYLYNCTFANGDIRILPPSYKSTAPADNGYFYSIGGSTVSYFDSLGNLYLPADPTTALGAATKQYVDNHSSGGGSSNTPNTTSTCSSAQALNFATSGDTAYEITLSANCTLTIADAGTTGTLRHLTLIIHPAGFQATLPASSSSLVWAGGSAPVPSTAADTVIILASTGAGRIYGGL